MRAIEITTPGPPDVLKLVERPDPSPGAGEVLIQVAAAGVNRPDLMQREGQYPPPRGASDLPGLEVSGRIIALGPDDDNGAPASARGLGSPRASAASNRKNEPASRIAARPRPTTTGSRAW